MSEIRRHVSWICICQLTTHYEGHVLDVKKLPCSSDMLLCNLETTNCIFSVNKMKNKVSHFHDDYLAIVFWLPWLCFSQI